MKMRGYPSRTEKREIQLYSAAEKGVFSIDLILYPSEITKLEKDGFSVSSINPGPNNLKNLFNATVSWANAYGPAIPHIVHSYIHGIIETKPKNSIENFAQELFVIAHKAVRH